MLSIENLSRTEKLLMMEALWDDLARDAVSYSSPEWHAEELRLAERSVAEGSANFVPWDAAKKALRDSKS
jgi:putative addiction module component (TIGR02574 family)